MTSEDFVQKYHDIEVPDYVSDGSGGVKAVSPSKTPVDEYCNAKHSNRYKKSHSERWKLRGTLLKFCAANSALPTTPLYRVGDGYMLWASASPVYYCDKDMMRDSFLGKGSPGMLWATIHLLSYWRGWMRYVDGVASIAPVSEIVDKYLGMDCNGFVGNYLKARYDSFHLGPNTPEEDYFYNRASIRDQLSELQADDVVLFLHDGITINWDANDLVKELNTKRPEIGHIAVVSRVAFRTDKEAQVVLSESRTKNEENGGPQSNTWTVKRLGKYRFDILSRAATVHSIVRVKHT